MAIMSSSTFWSTAEPKIRARSWLRSEATSWDSASTSLQGKFQGKRTNKALMLFVLQKRFFFHFSANVAFFFGFHIVFFNPFYFIF